MRFTLSDYIGFVAIVPPCIPPWQAIKRWFKPGTHLPGFLFWHSDFLGLLNLRYACGNGTSALELAQGVFKKQKAPKLLF
jgi:hypothetical protein